MADQNTTSENTNDEVVETGQPAVPDKPEGDTTKDGGLLTGDAGETGDTAPKTDDAEGGGEDGDDDAAKDSKEAEEIEYTDFNVPDGMEIDKNLLEAVTPTLKELKLPQSDAQKLVDAYARVKAKEVEEWGNQIEGWANETRSDKELAGGQGFDANIEVAKAGIREVFPDQTERQGFLDLLSHTGLANHPLMAKFCLRVGKNVVDDTIVKGGDAGNGPKSIADRMYPSNN